MLGSIRAAPGPTGRIGCRPIVSTSCLRRARSRSSAQARATLARPRGPAKSARRRLLPARSISSIRTTTRSRASPRSSPCRHLPDAPDLVVIAAPPPGVPAIVAAAGARGVAAAIIITAGLGHGAGSLAEAVREGRARHGLRLVGPNCLGVLAPRARLNASFAAHAAGRRSCADLAVGRDRGRAGGMGGDSARSAFPRSFRSATGSTSISAICSTTSRSTARTRAILLYVESINDARKFMSAARAAARIKPVVVVKSGRHAQGAKAAQTHTGALAGSDAVYDAAFRRAGLLRVLDLDELFAAAETLGRRASRSPASALRS